VRPNSFAEDPLRVVRGLRLVSQLGLDPDDATLEQMREEAASVALVSGERIGGGLRSDAMGELSKLLLGRQPAKALTLARDTGVLGALLPELEATIGFEQKSERQHLPLDEHIFAVVQAAADADDSLAVRLGALFHDAGKPAANGNHAERGARLAAAALARLRYPNRVRSHVTQLVRAHAFPLDQIDELFARRFLRKYGDELAFDLAAHKAADLRGKRVPEEEHEAVARLQTLLTEQRGQPHRLGDLAVNGADLISIGYEEGPALGTALNSLLDAVVEEPALNTREQLLERARQR
jgi:tRNA nucleotidyltransferase/poly(A) polymerase